MLALMPRSAPSFNFQMPNLVVPSLLNLQSVPMDYARSPATAAAPASPSPSKKPRLTLNTSNLASRSGKGATSLRLETLSATSPTARNTFQNRRTTESTGNGRPLRPALTPLVIGVPATTMDSPSQISLPDSADDSVEDSASPSTSETSFTSIDSSPTEPAPYKLPFNTTSILTNGPIPRPNHRRVSSTPSYSSLSSQKKVEFRAPLTEEIENSKYLLRHSDISLSMPALVAESSNASAGLTEGASLETTDGVDHAATPVAGRSKQREWVWTLGPVQQTLQGMPAPPEER